jgi:hypothetical protein
MSPQALAVIMALSIAPVRSPVLESEADLTPEKQLAIFNNYGDAYSAAKTARRMLVLHFRHADKRRSRDDFQSQVLSAPAIQEQLKKKFVTTHLPTSATGIVNGKPIRLLNHPAFGELHDGPGVAMIDLTDPRSRHYGHVVTVYPFKPGRRLSQTQFAKMLELPPGSLTQRTLIFAVRTHPEHPASADSRWSGILASETESHSLHQAQIGVQGHHNWDHRFHRINGRLAGMTAQEVCAESWPGQDLVDAAIECVQSWRQSPGHWSAVRSRNALFGYDMKRGSNGIWYVTGIFARR